MIICIIFYTLYYYMTMYLLFVYIHMVGGEKQLILLFSENCQVKQPAYINQQSRVNSQSCHPPEMYETHSGNMWYPASPLVTPPKTNQCPPTKVPFKKERIVFQSSLFFTSCTADWLRSFPSIWVARDALQPQSPMDLSGSPAVDGRRLFWIRGIFGSKEKRQLFGYPDPETNMT